MELVRVAALAAVVVVTIGCGGGGDGGDGVPTFDGRPGVDARGGGDGGGPGGPPGTVRWSVPMAIEVEHAPSVAADGTIVVQGQSTESPSGATVFAVNPDGTPRWSAETSPGSVPAPPVTIDGDTVLAPATVPGGALDGRLYRFALDDGAPGVHIDLTGPVGDGVAIAADGTIYVPATPLHVVRGDSIVFSFPMISTGKTGTNAAVGPSGNVHVGARGVDHNVHAVTPEGTSAWSRDDGAAYIDPIAVDDADRVYAVNTAGLLTVHEPTGDLAWSHQLPSGNSGGIVLGPDGVVYVGTLPAIPGDFTGELLYALREGVGGAGELVWSVNVGLGGITTTPALSAGGTLYVADYCSSLVAVRASDGEVLWSYRRPGLAEDRCSSWSSPMLGADGTVYAVLREDLAGPGALHAFVGDGTGPAASPWPVSGANPAQTGRVGAATVE